VLHIIGGGMARLMQNEGRRTIGKRPSASVTVRVSCKNWSPSAARAIERKGSFAPIMRDAADNYVAAQRLTFGKAL